MTPEQLEAFLAMLRMLPVEVVWTDLPDGTVITAPKSEEVCDFCLAKESPQWWEYPCRDFEWGPSGSLGSWRACEICSNLIEQKDYSELGRRCAPQMFKAADRGVMNVEESLADLYFHFQQNRAGDRRPL